MANEGCQVIAAVYARLSKEDTRTAGDNGTEPCSSIRLDRATEATRRNLEKARLARWGKKSKKAVAR